MKTEPQHREQLLENTTFMADGFRDLGYEVEDIHSAIIPLQIGEDENTFVWWKRLFDIECINKAGRAQRINPTDVFTAPINNAVFRIA